MSENNKDSLSEKLASIVIHGMQEKRQRDCEDGYARGEQYPIGFFVICHADSTVQVSSIAKSIEEEVYKIFGQDPWHKEGQGNGEWILLDFVDVVVHVFKTEKREHYRIEDLWGDAQMSTFQSA